MFEAPSRRGLGDAAESVTSANGSGGGPGFVNSAGVDLASRVRVKALCVKYDVRQLMGAGARSMVLRVVRRSDGREFAVKVVAKARLRPMERVALAREVAVFHHVNHPNIVSLEETLEDTEHVYIVTELLTGGDIRTCLNRQRHAFSGEQVLRFAEQMLSAISYLHSRGIVHRDIKLENFVVCSRANGSENSDAVGGPTVKLIDFGMVFWRKPGGELRSTHSCGTLGYAAPEVCENAAYVPEAADMWSLGVVLYALTTARLPFASASCALTAYRSIVRSKVSFEAPEWSLVPERFRELVESLLQLKPQQRPSAAAAADTLSEIIAANPLMLSDDGSSLRRASSVPAASDNEDAESSLADAADMQLFEFMDILCDQASTDGDAGPRSCTRRNSDDVQQPARTDGCRRKRNNSLDEFVEFIKDVLFRPAAAPAVS
eukprot:CAMPEP_0185852698 /NCGR_PEP_ID=MMETSP1354-20130828/15865_1 /TAXON_ID=708628 /ORGANISM="Erythrolobus madagascarensis, Strain CCMP3276" /LENGTH=432 /DNA_ID=CAMNT_0028554011 /DNA_START=160 /DNA_END=1458 /DNA_ORIENTATION=-